jgi:hypothetical protein
MNSATSAKAYLDPDVVVQYEIMNEGPERWAPKNNREKDRDGWRPIWNYDELWRGLISLSW